ncbi:MAG: hypothetical protein CMG00_06680 [Candidatus Marinimicrobia bacterium]|nr:hypothetical protein [Candidatus Neomarinimicrobiota bacterium]|tara:strand:+ start:3652 stop:3837 length:186 start_codon:yes stop_codon:yes gene_type:complete
MAKKQTFGDKTVKQGKEKGTFIKLVRAVKTGKGATAFKREILEVPAGKTPESYIKEKYPKK